ncbi:lipoprotein [Pasteurella skyensis]|uniref:Lipoprotein n=1 Tax=Phocoenobacter skyensis TaxID=97481 RepID=A0AAJ6NDY5_9PAST|nr:lipoprotein [Pasteurella skyensis]MDP8171163.1 lipoprotein [Pasteurella skyensis]MDP8175002.1 lipoprotein [Pasteurella skyensis]MDP8176170.1 lipoprotein [Pasteurella skyensis]MDP8198769.1 lipoprotein [Pasteurella skyensis]
MKKFILIAGMTAFLTACNVNDIDTVKNGILELNKTLTVGEAIDNYKGCKSVKWESFKADNGTKIVQATCPLTESVKEQLFWSDNIQSEFLQAGGNQICKQMTALIDFSLQNNFKDELDEGKKFWTQEIGMNVDTYFQMSESNNPKKTEMDLVLQFSINKDQTFQVAYIGTQFQFEQGEKQNYPTFDMKTLDSIYKNRVPSIVTGVKTVSRNTKYMYPFLALSCPYANQNMTTK